MPDPLAGWPHPWPDRASTQRDRERPAGTDVRGRAEPEPRSGPIPEGTVDDVIVDTSNQEGEQ